MFTKIPMEMKDIPNWVCWQSEPDPNSHSGIKKIPINPKTGERAKSNDSLTWSDFDTALRESEKYDGIGFMFSNSGLFGVDIDDCTDAIKDYKEAL